MTYRKGGDPQIIVCNHSALPPKPGLHPCVDRRGLIVEGKNERSFKALFQRGYSPLSPISSNSAKEQLTDGDKRKRRDTPFDVTKVGEPARVAGFHQIRKDIGVEQDNFQGVVVQRRLGPGTVDFVHEGIDVFAGRHNTRKGMGVERPRSTFAG